MKTNRKELLKVLEMVNPGLASKAIIEQSECFIFQHGRVYTFNDEVAVSHTIDLDFEGAVNGKKFLDLLRKSKDDELDIFIEEGMLRVHGKKSRAGLKTDFNVKLPFSEVGDNTEAIWNSLPEEFCNSIRFCLFSTSRDATRPLLTCVHINGDVVESCDNFRMTRRYMSSKLEGKPILIPADVVKDLADFLPIKVARIGGWLHFLNEKEMVFCCRTYSEAYPDVSRVLKVEGEVAKWPDKIEEAIERAGVFGESSIKGLNSRVTVELSEGRVMIRGEGDHGFFEEDMRLRFAGDASFEINASFFAEILQHTNEATIGKEQLKFEDENWVHIVGLMVKR